MQAASQGCTAHCSVALDYGLLHVPFNRLQHRSLQVPETYLEIVAYVVVVPHINLKSWPRYSLMVVSEDLIAMKQY